MSYKLEEIINTVINADCLNVMKDLPDKCIDLVLTDPPYANTGSESSRVTRSEGMPREYQFYEAWIRERMTEWKRLLKDNGCIFFTIDLLGAYSVEIACLKLGLRRPTVGIWNKDMMGMGFDEGSVFIKTSRIKKKGLDKWAKFKIDDELIIK